MNDADHPEIAVFGGSFDPPHLGHLLLAAYALSMTRVERVLVIPVFQHAFGKPLSDFDQRVRMCELAFADLKRVEISDHERRLGGVSRTLRLIRSLELEWPEHRLRLLVGTDILAEKDAWQGFEEICARAPLLVGGRGGFDAPDPRAPMLPQVSSSVIRDALARGEDISLWVPARVRAHIESQHLYAGDAPR